MNRGPRMKLEIGKPKRPTQDTSHDRLSVLRDTHRTLIALADGAGSRVGAQAAAARAVDELARCFRSGILPDNPRDWEMVLEGIDHSVFKDPVAGETSALVMLIEQGVVVGASVGDSLAYIVSPNGDTQLLTPRKSRGSRIGTGMASPIGIGPVQLDGRLITRRTPMTGSGESPFAFAAA